jgi:hypothetical protein
MIFNGNNRQRQDDELNTLFLCGKVLFLDDKFFVYIFYGDGSAATSLGDEKKLAQKLWKMIEKIMLKAAQYMT